MPVTIAELLLNTIFLLVSNDLYTHGKGISKALYAIAAILSAMHVIESLYELYGKFS